MSGVLVLWRSCFFVNDTATTEIYTLSLHDALPILEAVLQGSRSGPVVSAGKARQSLLYQVLQPGNNPHMPPKKDRKSTRLNSSHANISYAVFCLKKKAKQFACRQTCRNSS